MGSCLAGDSCIFSHDPALLMSRMNMNEGNGGMETPPSQTHPSLQVQDYDSFPALHQNSANQYGFLPSPLSSPQPHSLTPQRSHGYMKSPRRSFEARPTSMGGLSSSPGSYPSRPASRHQSREPTPSIPSVNDDDAFPTLGASGGKGGRKHHGKRGGHGHGHSNKENVPNSLADVVRMSPSPAPSLLRKGLMKNRSFTGTRENSAAAMAFTAPQHFPWLEKGEKTNQAYMKARQDAFKHGGLRNKFLQR